MTIREVEKNLGRRVRFTHPTLAREGAEYLLTGCTVRKGERGFYYQAELQDLSNCNSVLICRLPEIEAIT